MGDVGGTNTRLVLYEWDTNTDKEGPTPYTQLTSRSM